MPRFNMMTAQCQLCRRSISPMDAFIPVYRVFPTADTSYPIEEIVLADNRDGFIHLSHLQNVFNPNMIAVTEDQLAVGSLHNRVRVQVAL